MITLPDGTDATWITESGAAEPKTLQAVDDRLPAKVAMKRLRAGESLLWTGDYHNGCQLLTALQRRLRKQEKRPRGTLAQRWRQGREARAQEAELLGGLVIRLEGDGSVELRRAPDTRQAVRLAWGEGSEARVVSLRTLRGALGAAGWTEKGMEIPGLTGRVHPRYGVWAPTRSGYMELLQHLSPASTVLDVGCGTGALSFVLLQHGASSAVGMDIDPRAVACAQDNAQRLGLDSRFQAAQGELFGEAEPAELVIFNAPWIPEEPKTRLDRAVFDPGGRVLAGYLASLRAHMLPGGRGALIVSDLPERLGLRAPDELQGLAQAAGLVLEAMHTLPASHGRAKDPNDPLHAARAAEQLRLLVFR